MQGAEFKAEEVLATGNLTRTVNDRHGLRLLFKQSGNLGVFDSSTLLISLTSGLGLLALATLVVDLIATRVIPLRAVYAGYKEWATLPREEIEELGEEELRRFAAEDLVNPAPAFRERAADRRRLLGAPPGARESEIALLGGGGL